MIKVKDLENGYTIEYDNEGFMHNFSLKKDGVEVKLDNKQEVLENYVKQISKADNKFKVPIPAFEFSYDRTVKTGIITSANIPDKSFWFISDIKPNYGTVRRKENLGDKYFELTEENQFKIYQIKERQTAIKKLNNEIDEIAKTFNKQISEEYVKEKQGSKNS